MHKEIYKSLVLLIKIIIKPVRSIKNIEVISYNKNSMFILLFVSWLIFLFQSDIFKRMINSIITETDMLITLKITLTVVVFTLFVVIFTVTVLLCFKLFVFFYYTLVRVFTTITVNYKTFEHLLLPIVVIWVFASGLAVLIESTLDIPAIVIRNIINLWVGILIYLYLRLKFKESKARSAMVFIIPIILTLIVFLIR